MRGRPKIAMRPAIRVFILVVGVVAVGSGPTVIVRTVVRIAVRVVVVVRMAIGMGHLSASPPKRRPSPDIHPRPILVVSMVIMILVRIRVPRSGVGVRV